MKPKRIFRPLEIHQDHEVEIRPSNNARHFAQYYCVKCQKFVAWISLRDLEQMAQNPTI